MRVISCKTAFNNAKRYPHSAWDKAETRLAPEVWPELQPSFQIASGSKIFAIGSCFARNIEEHLDRLGYDVPTLRFSVPREESGAPRANAILNKYTPAAIWQEVDWAARIFERDRLVTERDCEPFAFGVNDKVVDTNLGGFVPVSRERFVGRRRQVFETWEHMFSAECVTLTLGLVEAWFDTENQLYIQQAPSSRPFLRHADRFDLHLLTYADSVRYVQSAIDTIRRFNPTAKILITTSPIPLARTFSGEDVITANTRAKSLLRAVCGEIVDTNDSLDYFPSYESAILTKDWSVWNHDKRHVTDAFVGKIVRRLASAYFAQADEASKLFQEAYTEHNNGNNRQAHELIEKALSKKAQDPEWWRLAATVQRDLLEFDEALDRINRALELEPGSGDNHYILATILMRVGDTAGAVKAAERAVQIDARKAHYHFLLGELLQATGSGDRALEAARTGLDLQPTYWRAHVRMSQILEVNGLSDEALASAREALRRRGDNPWVHRRIAGLLLKLGKPAEAREHAEKARELAPAKRSFRQSLKSLIADIDRLEAGEASAGE